MTKEEIKQICRIYDNLRAERDAATIAYNSEDTFWEHVLATYNLSQPSLPSNLDEAAEEYAVNHQSHDIFDCYGNPESDVIGKRLAFMAGAKWADVHSQELSLPSKIDEAAIDFADNTRKQLFTKDYAISSIADYDHGCIDGFKAGAEWMAGQGWISVDESLPKMAQEVIVLTDEIGTAPIYKINFGHIVDVNRCIDYNGWNIPGVKYWMPCPKIPGMND